MRNRKNIKILISFILFSLAILLTSLAINSYQISTKSRASGTDISLEPYCKDGYYSIPGEPAKCSRAPNCGGYNYDDLNTESKMPNPQSCTTDPHACGGYPPLCCYEMARTGDYTKCIGYWERLWCPEQLCAEARQNGASDEQCGGSCQCSHAFEHYCGNDVQIVSLAQRLGVTGAATPTSTSTPIPDATATPTVQAGTPTNTPTTQPGTTNTPTSTPTNIPINTPTNTPTNTYTPVPPTNTPTSTPTHTPTNTPTNTPTVTPTPTLTFTPAPTSTPQATYTPQPTYTPYPTQDVHTIAVNKQPPGITPWTLILVPIGLILLGLLL